MDDLSGGEIEKYLCMKKGKFIPEYTIKSQYGEPTVTINGETKAVEEWNQLSGSFGWLENPENQYYNKQDKAIKIPLAYVQNSDREAVLKDTQKTLEMLKKGTESEGV